MSARIVTVKPLPGAQFPLDATPDGVIELCAPHISLKKVENGTYASLSTSWLFVTDGDDSLCIQNPFSIMWLDQFELKVELLGGSMAAVALEPLQSINEDGYVDVEIPEDKPVTPRTPRRVVARPATYFLEADIVATCEILILRIQFVLSEFNPESGDVPAAEENLVELLRQLSARLQSEPRLIAPGELCLRSIQTFEGDLRLYISTFSTSTRQQRERKRRSLMAKVAAWVAMVRPIDFGQLMDNMDGAELAAEHVRGMNVVFIVGITGVGKSTLIHFLTGAQFTTEVNSDRVKILETRASGLVDVSNVHTSEGFTSATRYINPVVISCDALKALGVENCSSPIVLVDTPGFDDTGGPEVDISNSVGVMKAARCCSSVKVLFVCDNQVGSRGGQYRETVKTLLRMFGDELEQHVNAIKFVFTKINHAETIDEHIAKLSEASASDNSAFSSFVSVLEEQAENPLLARVGVDNPAHLLNILANSEAITNPGEIFRNFVSDKSMQQFGRQLQLHEDSIVAALRLNELSVVVTKINELYDVHKAVFSSETNNAVTNSTLIIEDHVLRCVQEYETVFGRFMKSKEELDDGDQLAFMTVCEKIVKLNPLRDYLSQPDFLESSFLKIEKFSLDLLKEFESFFAGSGDKDLPSLLSGAIRPLEQSVDRLSLLLRKSKELVSIAHSECLSAYRDGRIVQFVENNAKSMQKRVCAFIEGCYEIMLRFKYTIDVGAFEMIVEALDFLNRLQKPLHQYLTDVTLRMIEELLECFFDFSSYFARMKIVLSDQQQWIRSAVEDIVSCHNFLTAVSKLHRIGNVIDLEAFSVSTNEAGLSLVVLANTTLNRLSNFISQEGGVLDFDSISSCALLFDAVKGYCTETESWVVNLRRQLSNFMVTVQRQLGDLTSMSPRRLDIPTLMNALTNLARSDDLGSIVTIGFSFEFMTDFFEQVREFIQRVGAEVESYPTADTDTMLTVSEIQKYHRLLIICCECHRLSEVVSSDPVFSQHTELCTLPHDLQHHLAIFEQITPAFLRKCQSLLQSTEVFDAYREFLNLTILMAVATDGCFGRIQTLGNELHTRLTDLSCSFKSRIETHIHAAWEIVCEIINLDEAMQSERFTTSVKLVAHLLYHLQVMTSGFGQLGTNPEEASLEVYTDLYFQFPQKILHAYLADEGCILKLFSTVSRLAAEINDFSSMKTLAEFATLLGNDIDALVQVSNMNSHVSFTGFQTIGRNVYDSMVRVVHDSKAKIMVSISQNNFDEAIACLNQHKTQLTYEDTDYILRLLDQTGKNFETSINSYLQQARMQKFTVNSFMQLQEHLLHFHKFAHAFKSISDEKDLLDRCKYHESAVQRYFVRGVEGILHEMCKFEQVFEVESMMVQLTSLIPQLIKMPCHLTTAEVFTKGVSVATPSFDVFVGDLLRAWRVSIDDLVGRLCDRLLQLPLNKYQLHPPEILLNALNKCIALEGCPKCSEYKELHESLVGGIALKLNGMLAQSAVETDPDHIPFVEFSERVNTVGQVQPFVTREIFSSVQVNLTAATETINETKRQRETEKVKYQDVSSISRNLVHFENLILHKEFHYARELKLIIANTLRDSYRQYHDIFKQGDVVRGIEVASQAYETTKRVISTIKNCRQVMSNPTVVEVQLHRTLFMGYERFYYVDRGLQVHLQGRISDHLRKTMKYTIEYPSESSKYPDLFSDDDLTKYANEIILALNRKLLESVNMLETVKLENLDRTVQPIKIALKFLDLQSSAATYFNDGVVPSTAAILAGLHNFHEKLNEFCELIDLAFANGDVFRLKFLLATAMKIETTLEAWTVFVSSSFGKSTFAFKAIDLTRVLYKRHLQGRLHAAILEWANNVTSEQYLHNRGTTTRINADRDAYYQTVNRNYHSIANINEIVEFSTMNVGESADTAKRCRLHITDQINRIKDHLRLLHDQMPTENDAIYIECCNTYDNLRAIEENIDNNSVRNEARKATDLINEMFYQKFHHIGQEIVAINEISASALRLSDIDNCIDNLIMLKRMSNRLVIYSMHIDCMIDDITGALQRKLDGAKRFGMIAIQLKTRVEGRDGGEHVRTLLQHKAFDEITNLLRVRRTKQFTIYNVLGFVNLTQEQENAGITLRDDTSSTSTKLEGDDTGFHTRENLFYHFKEFDKLYWNLVLRGIEQVSKEQQMAHITQHVISTVLTDNYPTEEIRYRSLLAYIFAFWTLSRYSGSRDFSNASCSSSSASSPPPPPSSSSSSSSSSAGGASSSNSGPVDSWTDSLVQPHPAQVVALFRLFGIEGNIYDETAPPTPASGPRTAVMECPAEGNIVSLSSARFFSAIGFGSVSRSLTTSSVTYPTFPKQFAEILTGEGKSVVLAAVSTVMALLGYTVHCACYSAYLSKRDQDDFSFLFKAFNVVQYIEYGTFGSLCEKILDAGGNIRSLVQTLICGPGTADVTFDTSGISVRPRFLLIDEVDVFFSREYYGRLYEPYATIAKPSLANMALWLWAHREARPLTWTTVTASAEYRACLREFGAHGDIATEIVKGMLLDLKTVTSPGYAKDYVVVDLNGVNVIAYKEQDGVNHKIIKGYQTMFHYIREYESRDITEDTMRRALVGRIYCGGYSYAEIPKLYHGLMGVTGTLRQVRNGPQQTVLDAYDISRYSFVPSVYGASNRQFRKDSPADVRLVENARYFQCIVDEIEVRLNSIRVGSDYRRAVLVFFDTAEILDAFLKSANFIMYRHHAIVINETTPAAEKDGKIRAAATTGQIVLLTRVMGRGTDFICYDEKLLDSGGVHVLQTFLSDQNTEEVQIMGRTARQGNSGSYSLVLKIEDMEKFGLNVAAVQAIMNGDELYNPLARARDIYFRDQIYPRLAEGIAEIRTLFEESQVFVDRLRRGDTAYAMQFLLDSNKVEMRNGSGGVYRIAVLMDATGSMGPFILMAKNTVKAMFVRLHEFIRNEGIDADISVQYIAYRNYNAPIERVMEVSAWEPLSENPSRLFSFMDGITANYGICNEATELGLQHVNAECAGGQTVNAVIIIADYPPNTVAEVPRGRAKKTSWEGTRFAVPTNYEQEIARLPADTPVHCFHLTDLPQAVFTQIALQTGGTCQPLDVRAPDAATKLSDCVSMHISRAVGGQDLVDSFRRTYNVNTGYIG